MKTSLSAEFLTEVRAPLSTANAKHMRLFPGDTDRRQPVHTVYGGAQIFKRNSAIKLGELALKAITDYAPTSQTLTDVFHIEPKMAARVHERMIEKIKREAIEDFRIDFEDGYGNRPDSEEDGHAAFTAEEVAAGLKEGTLPPFIGIRIKTFSDELAPRAMRTLDIFISTMLEKTGGKLPNNFVVTLPKVVHTEQVVALCKLLAAIEAKNNLPAKMLELELMVETTQSIFAPEGGTSLLSFVQAAEGRCVAAHFGTYDYTASCNITAAYQYMNHPACDFARMVMTNTLAGTGVTLSDGATNVMPVGDKESVYRAWKLAYDHIRHSLEIGFYQGWDLHPAQVPVRYAAMYTFFLESFEAASVRLKALMDKAAQATLIGDVFDDAATGQGLLNYFLRGLGCGALSPDDVKNTGLTIDEIKTRSFVKILNQRKAKVRS